MVVNSHPLYQLSYRGSGIVPGSIETIMPFTRAHYRAPRGRGYNKPEQPPQFVCRTIARLFVRLCQALAGGVQAIVNIKN